MTQLPAEFFDFWLNQEHFFLDFEASGLLGDSYPIEIGIVGCDGSRFETLIKPATGWTSWSADAQDVHGIIRERLEDGMEAVEVFKHLNERYAGKVLWADSAYDRFWMAVLSVAAEIDPKFTVGVLYDRIPEDHHVIFGRFKKLPVAHRALQDAFDIRTAWFDYLKAMSENNQPCD
ncbi:exonuclease domain-containing protein [Pseudomonas serbica]|uniref:exonuclease domain-containing protein n=1 Tax=Pseudomonas serbica TaxID=2965074 RepID=UPI00237A71CB|nr:exonuclease domain-containing protein [Pseudomonas serbica]